MSAGWRLTTDYAPKWLQGHQRNSYHRAKNLRCWAWGCLMRRLDCGANSTENAWITSLNGRYVSVGRLLHHSCAVISVISYLIKPLSSQTPWALAQTNPKKIDPIVLQFAWHRYQSYAATFLLFFDERVDSQANGRTRLQGKELTTANIRSFQIYSAWVFVENT